jgi:hypothetical protein
MPKWTIKVCEEMKITTLNLWKDDGATFFCYSIFLLLWCNMRVIVMKACCLSMEDCWCKPESKAIPVDPKSVENLNFSWPLKLEFFKAVRNFIRYDLNFSERIKFEFFKAVIIWIFGNQKSLNFYKPLKFEF